MCSGGMGAWRPARVFIPMPRCSERVGQAGGDGVSRDVYRRFSFYEDDGYVIAKDVNMFCLGELLAQASSLVATPRRQLPVPGFDNAGSR
jgi:hypothetical protein